ncbi:hypothetical protein TNCV_2897501 [Trichonephila clavipes]|nr:hypothetical protein TNCV_2897501 [Trichonephila clavipes]
MVIELNYPKSIVYVKKEWNMNNDCRNMRKVGNLKQLEDRACVCGGAIQSNSEAPLPANSTHTSRVSTGILICVVSINGIHTEAYLLGFHDPAALSL